MEIILLERMQNLGELGDTVKVKRGYARNFLIPQGKAVPATATNIAAFEARRAALEEQQAEILAAARARAESITGLGVSIARKTGDEGRLFGSVGTQDIADALQALDVEVRKQDIRLPAGPLRETGDYDIDIHLHADVDATIRVSVIAEE